MDQGLVRVMLKPHRRSVEGIFQEFTKLWMNLWQRGSDPKLMMGPLTALDGQMWHIALPSYQSQSIDSLQGLKPPWVGLGRWTGATGLRPPP